MDFIIGFPRTSRKHDYIMIVVDSLSLSKVAHFLAVKSTNLSSEVAHIFVKDIVRLHDVPNKILSNRDTNFTSRFWKEFFSSLGRELDFGIAYHLQIDG